MESYHGTTIIALKQILAGKISVNIGGGELGQGFYTGEYLWEAKSWARMKHNSNAVVEVTITDHDFDSLDVKRLDLKEASCLRDAIKKATETKIYQEGVDVLWSPIVGCQKNKGDQFKWESDKSEHLLNSNNVLRREV